MKFWYYKHFSSNEDIPYFLNKHHLKHEDFYPCKDASGVGIFYYAYNELN